MTKYDKIYIPHDPVKHGVFMDDNYHVSHEGFMGPTGPPKEVVPVSNVIVLTIEDLREVLKDGYDEGRSSVYLEFDDFKGVWEQFFKRKGIQI